MDQVQGLQITVGQVYEAQWKAFAWRSRSTESPWAPEGDLASRATRGTRPRMSALQLTGP